MRYLLVQMERYYHQQMEISLNQIKWWLKLSSIAKLQIPQRGSNFFLLNLMITMVMTALLSHLPDTSLIKLLPTQNLTLQYQGEQKLTTYKVNSKVEALRCQPYIKSKLKVIILKSQTDRASKRPPLSRILLSCSNSSLIVLTRMMQTSSLTSQTMIRF